MRLKDAKLCINCEEVFDKGNTCPKCGSTSFWYIQYWIKSAINELSKWDIETKILMEKKRRYEQRS